MTNYVIWHWCSFSW